MFFFILAVLHLFVFVVCFVVGCVLIVVIGLCLCLIGVGDLSLLFFCMHVLGCPLIV